MEYIILILILAFLFAAVNFMLPKASGLSGCLIFLIIAIIVIFFMGSCVRLIGAM